MQIKVVMEVNDDFEKGCCPDCPFVTYDEVLDWSCPFSWTYDKCRIEYEQKF